jgi:hypothetical protein
MARSRSNKLALVLLAVALFATTVLVSYAGFRFFGSKSSGTISTPPPASAAQQGLIIPLYIYPKSWEDNDPSNAYNQVAALPSTVPTIVIINPSDGEDALAAPNINWQWGIKKLENKTTIGYIPTNWGKRDMTEVKRLVDGYINNGWGVKGFFFDETSSTGDYAYYLEIATYVRQKPGGNLLVVFNPGTASDTVLSLLADISMEFEKAEPLLSAEAIPASWEQAKRRAAVVFDVPTASSVPGIVRRLQGLKYFWVYITENNSYTRLPSYLTAITDAQQQLS